MFTTRSFIAAFFALIAAFVPVASYAAASATAEGASQFVGTLANDTLATISDKSLDKDQKESKLETLFTGNVDIAWVGRFVMGTFWRQATDDQKQRYLQNYQTFIIRHYTMRFTDYTSGSFKITNSRDDGDNEYTVSMQIQGGNGNQGQPVLVDYKVRNTGGSYKIFDIIVEGVSMITTQRSEFASVLNQHGIDYLITQLQARSKTGE